jgi:hypothetical protein
MFAGELCLMNSSMTAGFCKNEDCPSSDELLCFQTGDLSLGRGSEVRKHLSSCEFCEAEVEFYSHYPPDESSSEVTQIPAPLFELAEALLKNRHAGSSSLYSLFNEQGEILTDKS